MNKSKKVFNNFKYGVIAQIVTLCLGIIIPKIIIVSYGSEVNGLLSSIKQVFVYVALLEAGIGTASLQALFKPVADNDHNRISEIMSATSQYYKRTGRLYGIAVILLSIIYPLVVNSDIALPIIVSVILLQGASGVINYYFQGKYTILLRVDGKGYITTNATTIVSVIAKLLQIALIYVGFNVVVVQTVYFLTNLMQMIYIGFYVRKHYSWLNLKAKPDYDSLIQSKNVIIHQISGLIFNNTDVIVLTYFCGLKTVSVYSLYALVITCVSKIIDSLCSSFEFVLGQMFNSNRERFLKTQEVYETYYMCFSFAMFTITLIMFPSFIELYSRGITDADYIDKYLPYLFVILNLLMYARRTSSQIINFAGHFKQTQWRSVLESVINLTVSLVLVNIIGIYGVLVGTIAALLYRTNDVIIYANWNILGRKPFATYRRWGQNIVLLVICCMVAHRFIPSIADYKDWLIVSTLMTLIVSFSFLLVDSLCDVTCFNLIFKKYRKHIKI